ncbi:rab-GTPase-TBC domain-containing protein, partial [Gamsiella multidivaricata]|uniref:rab-GTPase-TBC domain-containing protein n=1 Tax=Gamsiella multidivaricata TaxID=101098 RepID=UPI00221E9CEF
MSSDSKALEPQEGDEEIDWEFWGMLVQDYTAVASKLPHLLAARVRQGLPSKLRGLIWQSMSQASSTYLETMYTQLLKEYSPYERIIQRDLARTFPQIDMFKEKGDKGQESLRNVLKAYSLYDPHVGYCQGLGFLVGPLLMNMGEKEAFCVFVRLMETYDMRTMFTMNMEGLQLRLYQFSALLSEQLPMLHAHLSLHSIHAAMYASQWFLSLFAYTYPLPLVLRIYDVVFTEGAPETIMRVAVAFLKKNEEKLMQLQEFEELLEMLSSKLYDVY